MDEEFEPYDDDLETFERDALAGDDEGGEAVTQGHTSRPSPPVEQRAQRNLRARHHALHRRPLGL